MDHVRSTDHNFTLGGTDTMSFQAIKGFQNVNIKLVNN